MFTTESWSCLSRFWPNFHPNSIGFSVCSSFTPTLFDSHFCNCICWYWCKVKYCCCFLIYNSLREGLEPSFHTPRVTRGYYYFHGKSCSSRREWPRGLPLLSTSLRSSVVVVAAFFGLLRNKKDPTFPQYYKVVQLLLSVSQARFCVLLRASKLKLLPAFYRNMLAKCRKIYLWHTPIWEIL